MKVERIALVALVLLAAACPSNERPSAPLVSVVADRTSVDFGAVVPGTRRVETVRLFNTGDLPVMLDAAGETGFWPAFETSLTPTVLDPGEALTYEISFEPWTPGKASSTLNVVFETQSQSGQLSIAVSGSGLEVPCGIEPTRLDFGAVAVSGVVDRPLRIVNASGLPWWVKVEVIGTDASAERSFAPADWPNAAFQVPPANGDIPGAEDVVIRFHPMRAGEHRAQVALTAPGFCDHRVELVGRGVVDGTIEERFPSACEPTECADPVPVATVEQLLAAAELEWKTLSAGVGTCLKASPDLIATAPITVASSTVRVPKWCVDASECSDEPGLSVEGQLAGVQLLAADGVNRTHDEVQIQEGTVFRLRGAIQDTHPSKFNYTPSLHFLGSCHAPCEDGQLSCAATHTCWDSATSYCAFCLAGPGWVCACFDGARSVADGATCSWHPSGDTFCPGQCNEGWCNPTVPGC